MGNNSSKFEMEAYYASKSLKQLSEELKTFETAVSKWDTRGFKSNPSTFIEHIGYLKMKIAERIGKKEKK